MVSISGHSSGNTTLTNEEMASTLLLLTRGFVSLEKMVKELVDSKDRDQLSHRSNNASMEVMDEQNDTFSDTVDPEILGDRRE